MLKKLANIFKALRPAKKEIKTPGQMRKEFAMRYAHFRRLLTANNNALQAMADLEKMYYGEGSYRMAEIRIKTTAILVNIYKMITSLITMADNRYSILLDKFDTISANLEQIIEKVPETPNGPFILPLAQITGTDREQVGDKMANLAEAGTLASIQIPPGFVISATATRHFLEPQLLVRINKCLQELNPDKLSVFYKACEEIEQLIINTPVSSELQAQLYQAYDRLERATRHNVKIALRSSALGEDDAGISFAGLYRTRLNVTRSTFIESFKEIVASKYNAKAISYRLKRGYRHQDIEMCVGCLVMVDALISGVTYSRDPMSSNGDYIRINATRGFGQGVVDGTRDVHRYLLSRQSPHALMHFEHNPVNDSQGQMAEPLLTDEQLRQLAQSALMLEQHFGQPQDIEWSYDHQGQLFILQSRPVQDRTEQPAVHEPPPPSGAPPIAIGGITASDGTAAGPIFHVLSSEDVFAFPKGGILLLEYPLPEFAPLVNRAAAVIAQFGSEVGHLATVCRELGLPALFGLDGAIQRLRPGQLVTVNAGTRTVYHGYREDLLRCKKVKRNPMAGSPVQQILTEALQHITPLNLNDPNSSKFKASWCETLHDITRFCHEKSVTEMFNFSGTTLDRTSAKRLVGDIPLEWWVINLADGIAAEHDDDSPVVRLEDIVSVPMLAICRGVSAFPWKGPPPVSARGMGTIIFQSMMRPDLDPANPSKLVEKNYFLISKNFCNLSVRLGYHYAMIEAYLSELLTESYITFRFQGGAADLRRKTVRTRLLSEVLQHYGFSVELRSDSLLARIKQKPLDYLTQRLQVLGYLILHARQLDMVMDDKLRVARYKSTFITQLDGLLLQAVSGEVDNETCKTVNRR